jgi:hypothetical protein
MPPKRSSINLSVSSYEKQQLEALALRLGIYWGDKPNISAMLKRIAQGKLRVVANDDWSTERIETLKKVQGLLCDRGAVNEALTIAHLLLERSELTLPLRKDLISFVAKPAPSWRITIDKLCNRMQPFRLTYQDAADRLWEFHIYYAEIQRHDDREYLDCWCAETEGNKEILPPLRHNWCLRLDRVPEETAITEIPGQWGRLGVVEVEFHLFNNLAFAYRSKKQSEEFNNWHPEQPTVRQVIRKVTNTFWFFREIRRYGPDCEIISPPELREQYRQDCLETLKRYDLTSKP